VRLLACARRSETPCALYKTTRHASENRPFLADPGVWCQGGADGVEPSGQEAVGVRACASMSGMVSAVETCCTTQPGRGKGNKDVHIREDRPHTKKIGAVYPSNRLIWCESGHAAQKLWKNHLQVITSKANRPTRTSGSTGTEISGRDLIGKRPLHRLLDFAASELESYQKGCRKQKG
jgi:hypothetical protein